MNWNSTFNNPTKPMTRGTGYMRRKTRGKAKRENKHLADMCHGQSCYLLIPGVCTNNPSTVVPAHSNQSRDGKGMGKKADDAKTCPACFACHSEIDQGHKFNKLEKFLIWDAGYARWVPVRERLLKAGE